jgi:hypothetical protein
VTDSLRKKITAYLATTFRVDAKAAKECVPDSLPQWGRIQIANGGEVMHARGYHELRSNTHDASFV